MGQYFNLEGKRYPIYKSMLRCKARNTKAEKKQDYKNLSLVQPFSKLCWREYATKMREENIGNKHSKTQA
jgi:hypothetical protein